MDAPRGHRLHRGHRLAGTFALLAFVLGTQHCALMGFAGRDCGRPDPAPVVAPAGHACCAARHTAEPAHAPARIPTGEPSCCLQPAPVPAALALAAPAATPFTPILAASDPAFAPAVATRLFASPPVEASPPGLPAPEPSLGRAPPLA